MPKREMKHEPWYDVLTMEEAMLVNDYDKMIEVCRSSLASVVEKRGKIRTRAQMRMNYQPKRMSKDE